LKLASSYKENKLISTECRNAISNVYDLLEPYSNYDFIKNALDTLKSGVANDDWETNIKIYQNKRRKREKILLSALKEGKTVQYCYSRDWDITPRKWIDLPSKKAYNFIEHGMWDQMKVKDEEDEQI
jgi:hypothetical protein